MISEPTVVLGALWIPYRRSASLLKDILACVSNSNSGDDSNSTNESIHRMQRQIKDQVSMIYCHADIQGAFMNDNIQSQEGLEVTDFPANIPTYTGELVSEYVT